MRQGRAAVGRKAGEMKIVTTLLIGSLLFLSGCGEKKICGKEYSSYGLFTLGEKDESIKYKFSFSSIFLSVVFSETLMVPVLFIGFALYEPVEPKMACP